MILNATMFAHLVGRYIRMERRSTEAEERLTDEPTVGMETYVTMVADSEEGVEIHGDTTEVWVVKPSDAQFWKWTVWENEAARRRWIKYHD